MKKLFFGLLLAILTTSLYSQSIQGKVIDVSQAEGYVQSISLSKRTVRNSPIGEQKIGVGSLIGEREFILTGPGTIATILVDDLKIKIKPLSIVQLWSAYISESKVREIWNLYQGEIGVDLETKKEDSKVAFNTKNGNSILITGTSFTLTSTGLVKLKTGSVSFFDRNFFKDRENDFERAAKTKPLGELKGGQIGDGRGAPINDPEFTPGVKPKEPVIFTPIENKKPEGGDKKDPPPEEHNQFALPPEKKRPMIDNKPGKKGSPPNNGKPGKEPADPRK